VKKGKKNQHRSKWLRRRIATTYF